MSIRIRYILRGFVILASIVSVISITSVIATQWAVAAAPDNSHKSLVASADQTDSDDVSSGYNILILNSYHRGFDWTDRQVSGISDYFAEKMPDADLFVEHLDTKRFQRRDVWGEMLEIVLSKYPPGFLDIIIVTDDNAYRTLAAHHDRLGSIPAVFCGINNFDPQIHAAHPDMTGILEYLDFEGTWGLGCKLLKRSFTRVALIVDNTPTGVAYRKEAENWFASRKDLEPIWLDGKDLSHDELIDRLQKMSDDTLVIMGVWKRDRLDHYLRTGRYYPLVAQATPGPVFSLVEIGLEDGLVGGSILDGYLHGQAAAAIAADVLSGADISKIEVLRPVTTKIDLDYRVLDKWGLDKDFPDDWIIRHKPVSFYAEHRAVIWTAVVVMTLELGLIVLLIFNIIQRRKTAKALLTANRISRDSEENLRITLKSIGDAVISTDRDSRVVQMNHVAEELTGWDADEAKGKMLKEVFQIVNSHTRREVENPVSKVLKLGVIQGLANHTVLISREGQEYQIADSAAPIISANGNIQGVVLTFRDVSAEYEKDRLLNEARQRMDLVLAHTGEMITYVDRDLLVKWTNCDGKSSWVVAQKGQQQPMCCHELLFGLDRICDNCLVTNAIKSGRDMTHEMKLDDGRIFQVHSTPVKDNRGSVIGAVETARDVTEQASLKQQLVHSDRMNAIGRLAGGIAHDFNNLLQVILGYGELLELDLKSDARQTLGYILDAGKKARNLVSQLLLFSRRRELSSEVVDPIVLLNDTVNMLKPLIGENIELRVHSDGMEHRILADPEQIQQVIINICINARDAMSGSGVISITVGEIVLGELQASGMGLDRCGGYVSFNIRDDGPGIEPENLEHIFEPFFTTKQMGKGSGLGLSTAYAIVKRHGGDIKVCNSDSGGAEFEILLPATDMVVSAESESGKASCAAQGVSNGLVLLGEDEEMVRRYTTRLLENMGFSVEAAIDGAESVKLFRAKPEKFRLVILDAMMPGMNGPQACERIKEIRPDIPVLFATGYSRELLEGDFLLKTPGKLLQKPFTAESLARAIDELLNA